MSRTSQSYEMTLARLYLVDGCQRAALLHPGLKHGMGYRLISEGVEKGHISAETYREIYGHRYYPQDFVHITRAGLNYLRQQTSLPGLQFIPGDIGRLFLFDDRRTQSVINRVRDGNALLLATDMGATMTEYIYTGETNTPLRDDNFIPVEDADQDEPDQDPSSPLYEADDIDPLRMEIERAKVRSSSLSMVRAATYKRTAAAMEIEPMPLDAPLYYFPKQEIAARLKEAKRDFDNRFCQAVGLLVTPETSIILYHARHDGLPWTALGEKNDKEMMYRFSKFCAPYDNLARVGNDPSAAIIIYGAKNFGDIARNKWQKRKAGTKVGDRYKSVYAVPLGSAGAAFLSDILSGKVAADVQTVLDKYPTIKRISAVQSSPFNHMAAETPILIGADMDLKKACSLHKWLDETKDNDFITICYKWQIPYYEAIKSGGQYLLIKS